jgi:hypothetical protein
VVVRGAAAAARMRCGSENVHLDTLNPFFDFEPHLILATQSD